MQEDRQAADLAFDNERCESNREVRVAAPTRSICLSWCVCSWPDDAVVAAESNSGGQSERLDNAPRRLGVAAAQGAAMVVLWFLSHTAALDNERVAAVDHNS